MDVKFSVDENLSRDNSFACWKETEDIGDSNNTKSFDSAEKDTIENKTSGHLGDMSRHMKLENERCITDELSKTENKTTDAVNMTNSTKNMFRQIFVMRKFQKKNDLISGNTYDSDESYSHPNMLRARSDVKGNDEHNSVDKTVKSKFKLWLKRTEDSLTVKDYPTLVKKKKAIFSFFKKSKYKESTPNVQNTDAVYKKPSDQLEKSKTKQFRDNESKSWVRKFKSNGPESYQNVHVRWCNNSYLKRSYTALDSVIEKFQFGSIKAFTVQTITDNPLKLQVNHDKTDQVVTVNESQYSEEKVYNIVEYETVKSKSLNSDTPRRSDTVVEEEPSEIINSIDLENASASFSFVKEEVREVGIKDDVAQCDHVKPKGVDIEIMTDPMMNEVKISVKTSFNLSENPKADAPLTRNNLTETTHTPGCSSYINSNCSSSSKLNSSCSPEVDVVFNNMGVKRKKSTQEVESKETARNLYDLQSVEKLINNTLKKMVVTSITSKYSSMVPNMNRKRYEMLKKLHVMHFASKFLSFIKTMVDDESAYEFPEIYRNKLHGNRQTDQKKKVSETLLYKQQQYVKLKNKMNQNKHKSDKRRNFPKFSNSSSIRVRKGRVHTEKLGYEDAIKQIVANRFRTKCKDTNTTNTIKDDISTFEPKHKTHNKDYKSNDSTTKKIKEILEDMDIYLMTQSNLYLPTPWINESVDTLFDNLETKKAIEIGDTYPNPKSLIKFKDRAVSPCFVAKPKTAHRETNDRRPKKNRHKTAETQSSVTRTIGQSYISTQTSEKFTQKWFKKMWKARTDSSQSRSPVLGISNGQTNSTTTFRDQSSKKYKARSQSLIRVYNQYGVPGLLRYFGLAKRSQKKSMSKKTGESDLSQTNLPTTSNSRQSWDKNLDKPLPIFSTRSLICVQGEASNEWDLDVDHVKDSANKHNLDNSTIATFTKVKKTNIENDKLSKVAYWTEQCRHNPRFQHSRQYNAMQEAPTKSMRSFGTSVDSADTIDNKENLKIVYLNSKEIMIVGDIMNNLSERNKKDNKICLKVGNKDGKYYVVQRDRNFVEEEVGIDKLVGDPKYTNTIEQECYGRNQKTRKQYVNKSEHKERSKSSDKNNIKIDIKIKDTENFKRDKAKYFDTHTKDEDDTESDEINDSRINQEKTYSYNCNNGQCIKITHDENLKYDDDDDDKQEDEAKSPRENSNYSDESNTDTDDKRDIVDKNIEVETIKGTMNNYDKDNDEFYDDDYRSDETYSNDHLMDSDHLIKIQDVKNKANNSDKIIHKEKNKEKFYDKNHFDINDVKSDVTVNSASEIIEIKEKRREDNTKTKSSKNDYTNNDRFYDNDDGKSPVSYTSEEIVKVKEINKDFKAKAQKPSKSINDKNFINDDISIIIENSEHLIQTKERNKHTKTGESKCYKSKNSDNHSRQTNDDDVMDNNSNVTGNSDEIIQIKETNNDIKTRANNFNKITQNKVKSHNINNFKLINDNTDDILENSEHMIQKKERNKVIRSKENNFSKIHNDERPTGKSYGHDKNNFEDSERIIPATERNKVDKSKANNSSKIKTEGKRKSKFYNDSNNNNVIKDDQEDITKKNEQVNLTKEKKIINGKANNPNKISNDAKQRDKSNDDNKNHIIGNNVKIDAKVNNEQINETKEKKKRKANISSKINNEDRQKGKYNDKNYSNNAKINVKLNIEQTNQTKEPNKAVPRKANNSVVINNDHRQKDKSKDDNQTDNIVNDDKTDVIKNNEQTKHGNEKDKAVKSRTNNSNNIKIADRQKDKTKDNNNNSDNVVYIDESDEKKNCEKNYQTKDKAVKSKANNSNKINIDERSNNKSNNDNSGSVVHDDNTDVIKNSEPINQTQEKHKAVKNKTNDSNRLSTEDREKEKALADDNINNDAHDHKNAEIENSEQIYHTKEKNKAVKNRANNSNNENRQKNKLHDDNYSNIVNEEVPDNFEQINEKDNSTTNNSNINKYAENQKNILCDKNYDNANDIINEVMDNNEQIIPIKESTNIVENENDYMNYDEFEPQFYNENNLLDVNDDVNAVTRNIDQIVHIKERMKDYEAQADKSNTYDIKYYDVDDDKMNVNDNSEQTMKTRERIKDTKHSTNKYNHNTDEGKDYDKYYEYGVEYDKNDVDIDQISPIKERYNDIKKRRHSHTYDDKHKTKFCEEYNYDVTDGNRDDRHNSNHVKIKEHHYGKQRSNYPNKNDNYNKCACKTCEKSNDDNMYDAAPNYTDFNNKQMDKIKEKVNFVNDPAKYYVENDDNNYNITRPMNKIKARYNELNKKQKVVIADEYLTNDDDTKSDYKYYNNHNDEYIDDDNINSYDMDFDVADNTKHSNYNKYKVNFYTKHKDEGENYVDYDDGNIDDNYDYDEITNQKKLLFNFDETANDIYVSHHEKLNNHIIRRNKVQANCSHNDKNKMNLPHKEKNYVDVKDGNDEDYEVDTDYYVNRYQSKQRIKMREENVYRGNHNYKIYKAKYSDDRRKVVDVNGTAQKTNIKEAAKHIFVADTSNHKKNDKSKTKVVILDNNNNENEDKYAKSKYHGRDNEDYDAAEYQNENFHLGILKRKDSPNRERHNRHNNHQKQKSGSRVVISSKSKSRKKSDTITVYSCHNSFNSGRGTSGDRSRRKSNESLKNVVRFSKHNTIESTKDKVAAASSDEVDDVPAALIHNSGPKLYTNTFFGRNTWNNEKDKYSSHVLISDQLISNKFGRKKSANNSVHKTIKTGGTSKTIYSDIMSINYKNIIDEFYPDELGKHWPPKKQLESNNDYYSELQDADDENTIHVEMSDLSDSSGEADKNKIMLLLKFNLFTDVETNTDIANSTKDAHTNIDKSSIFDKTSSIFDLPVKDNTVRPIVGIVINDSKEIKTARQDSDGKKVLAWAHDQIEELKAEKDKYKRRINLLQNNLDPNPVALVTELDTKFKSARSNSPQSHIHAHRNTRNKDASSIHKTCNQTYHSQNYYYNWQNKNRKISKAQNEYVFLSDCAPECQSLNEDSVKSESVYNKKYDDPADVLQSNAAKEAVVQLYAEKVVIGDTEHYVSRLPKLDHWTPE